VSPNERAADNAGLRATIHAARIAAITMETAPGSTNVLKQAAVATLYAFAESAETLALAQMGEPSEPAS
jgi:hypothetical protein